MNILKRAWQWLLIKHQKENTVTDQVVEVPAADTDPVDAATAETAPSVTEESPAEEVKAGVQDFEEALAFVESGVAKLGEAAKDELKELAKKYL